MGVFSSLSFVFYYKIFFHLLTHTLAPASVLVPPPKTLTKVSLQRKKDVRTAHLTMLLRKKVHRWVIRCEQCLHSVNKSLSEQGLGGACELARAKRTCGSRHSHDAHADKLRPQNKRGEHKLSRYCCQKASFLGKLFGRGVGEPFSRKRFPHKKTPPCLCHLVGQFFATENVEMQVLDRLTAVLAAVGDHAVAV